MRAACHTGRVALASCLLCRRCSCFIGAKTPARLLWVICSTCLACLVCMLLVRLVTTVVHYVVFSPHAALSQSPIAVGPCERARRHRSLGHGLRDSSLQTEPLPTGRHASFVTSVHMTEEVPSCVVQCSNVFFRLSMVAQLLFRKTQSHRRDHRKSLQALPFVVLCQTCNHTRTVFGRETLPGVNAPARPLGQGRAASPPAASA